MSRHIATLLSPAWGHALPYLHLAIRLLRTDPSLVITIVQHNLVVPKMTRELEGCKYDARRLSILGVGSANAEFTPAIMEQATKELVGGWLEILAGLMATDASTKWPRPRTVHMDFLGGGFVFQPTKKLLGLSVKVVMFTSSGVTTMPDVLDTYNFPRVVRRISEDEAKREGRTQQKIIVDVITAWNGSDKLDGRVLHIPGIPDIYDYEHIARGAGDPDGVASVIYSAAEMSAGVDAFIALGSAALEPGSISPVRDFYRARGQVVFAVGPQMHDSYFDGSCGGSGGPLPCPRNAKLSNEKLKRFLEDKFQKHGPRSVLYISFGSLFFPRATPEHVNAMVDVLLQLDEELPFVFVLAGKLASLPEDIVNRIHNSGRGLVCDFWVEQQAVLQSGCVGWVLTHGGYKCGRHSLYHDPRTHLSRFSSITESLTQGIPLIVWPIGAEQAVNAVLLSTGPAPVAIELFQIRAGAQLGPSLRSDAPRNITGTLADATAEFRKTFADLKSAKGRALVRNALSVRKLWRQERAVRDSDPARELLRLVEY
ncbi:unnamed protein product [Mycena citricolor]|uniref:Uncharacterized protein n=1 Tax=Mycena citricolor TaxID=2018698 RepID=A0AAD2HA59_9AGAR|nr:unnamed protein product [Mycena citricolor]